jgi:hypothetical protein
VSSAAGRSVRFNEHASSPSATSALLDIPGEGHEHNHHEHGELRRRRYNVSLFLLGHADNLSDLQ